MAKKYHVNTETGRYGECTAQQGNCPISKQEEHFNNEKDAVRASEKILSQKHMLMNSLKKRSKPTKSLRNSLIDDFRAQAELAKENNELQSAATFNQFANFANNCHDMSNSQTISYMSNMADLEGNDNPKVKEAVENIILENSENFKDYNEFKPINLPFSVVEHPKGYEFYKAMENTKTSDEQMKLVRFFDYGDVDKSLIVGKDTEKFIDKLEEQRNREYEDYRNRDESQDIAIESYFVAIENDNKKYSVWMLDEDGINLGVVHNTNQDEAYENLREIWNNKELAYENLPESYSSHDRNI